MSRLPKPWASPTWVYETIMKTVTLKKRAKARLAILMRLN